MLTEGRTERAILMGVPLGFERAYNFDSSQREFNRTEQDLIVQLKVPKVTMCPPGSHIMHTYTVLSMHLHYSWYNYKSMKRTSAYLLSRD
jgi:hypothetical protein